MSKRPTGTSMDADRLLALRAAPDDSPSTLAVEAEPLVDGFGAAPGDRIDWETDEREGVPALVFGLVGDEPGESARPRELREYDDALLAPVPDPLAAAEPPDGLGLDVEAYDEDNPLLFEGIAMEATAAVVPTRYDDGTPYDQEPLPDAAEASDPVAQETIERETDAHPAPNPETLDAPIDPEIVREAIAGLDEPYTSVSTALEGIHRRELLSEADTVGDYPPLTVDERAVCVVPEGTWSEITSRFDADETVDASTVAVDGAQAVHERQAERLIEAADAPAYRDALDDNEVVVADERETAEWEVAEPGTSR